MKARTWAFRAAWLLSCTLPLACGGAPGPAAFGTARVPPPTIEPTEAERALLEAVRAHRDPGMGAVRAALAVGGPRDPAELDARAAALDEALTAITASLPRGDAAQRGAALLRALFATGPGRPLLVTYEVEATTLYEVVATGRFNCVSATMLYILAARRAGLDARPVLLPSHARAVVVIAGARHVVETTTPYGFDAPASVSRQALDRARPRGGDEKIDLYADERGTEVEWGALLGIAYGNLGIFAQARGETALAAALLEREISLTPPAQVPLVRAQQASLLTELATTAMKEGRMGEALALSFRADDAASDAETKRLTDQNVASIGTQKLLADEPKLSDAALASFAEPFKACPGAYGDVQALVLTLVADRRLRRGDVDGSASALHEAATFATSDVVRDAAGHNERLGELNRVAKLSTTDPEAAWAALSRLGPADPTLAVAEREARDVVTRNRAVFLANAGKCQDLEPILATLTAPRGDEAELRAGCHERHAIDLSNRGEGAAAIDAMRTAVRLDPRDANHRKNLGIVLEKEVDRLVHAAGCDRAAPLIAEGRAALPGEAFWAEATAFCGMR